MAMKRLRKVSTDGAVQTPSKRLKPGKTLRTTPDGKSAVSVDPGPVSGPDLSDSSVSGPDDSLFEKARHWYANQTHLRPPMFNIQDVYPVAYVCLLCGKKVRADGGQQNIKAIDQVKHHAANRHGGTGVGNGIRIARELVYYNAETELSMSSPFRYQCVACDTAHASIRSVVVHQCVFVDS